MKKMIYWACLLMALALLPAAIAGLRGKNLRVCGALVTAVMLLLIFDTPRKLLTLALFWTWQLALIFSYLASLIFQPKMKSAMFCGFFCF